MSFQKNTFRMNEAMSNTVGKTTLNPHAVEFVPYSRRSSPGNISSVDTSPRPAANVALGKAALDRTESSVSNNSDEEARQYWSRQLPDDITPDFKVTEDEESREMASLLLGGLSLNDSGYETSKFVPSVGNQYALSHRLDLSSPHSRRSSFTSKSRYALSSYEDDSAPANFLNSASEPWAKTSRGNQIMGSEMDSQRFVNSTNGFVNSLLSDPTLADDQINPLEFLAFQFPGFAAESLAEVYYANQCDLNLTIDMLTQLELQVDAGFDQNLNSKTAAAAAAAPNLSPSDFPALSGHGDHSSLQKYGEDAQRSGNRSSNKENLLFFKSGPSIPAGGAVDFASAVKKLASQNSGTWKHEKNSSAGSSVGSSRSSQLLASSYNNVHGVKNHGSARAAPVWLETGEAVGNMYSELREEARDHARVRNVYFEQARQAYLIGNKALAKELSMKGQLFNMRMKTAHGQAQESIYRQRNPVSPEMQLNGRGGQERMMIDLHGLHVSEAIHKLKHELTILRHAARANDQRIQVFICVGTGHHTKGSRTPVRLPVAVQQFLLEEGIDYSETQPGLLRVVIY